MKLYKAKGAVALALAMSMFCPQVFAAEALSAEAGDKCGVDVHHLIREGIADLLV